MEDSIMNIDSMKPDELQGRLMLFQLAYGSSGNTIRFDKDIYGFIDDNSRVELIDFVHNTVILGKFAVPLLTEDVIILSRSYKSFTEIGNKNKKSYILNSKTFEIVYETKAFLDIADGLIYEIHENEKTSFEKTERNIFDYSGQYLGTIKACGTLEIAEIEDTSYYLIKSGNLEELDGGTYWSEGYINILKREGNDLKVVWESGKYDVSFVSSNIVLFTDKDNTYNRYVYNFRLNELIK